MAAVNTCYDQRIRFIAFIGWVEFGFGDQAPSLPFMTVRESSSIPELTHA
jgi:hypothetical protein